MESRQHTFITNSIVTSSDQSAFVSNISTPGNINCIAGKNTELILHLLNLDTHATENKQELIPEKVEVKDVSLSGDVTVIAKQSSIVNNIKCTGSFFNFAGLESKTEAEQMKPLLAEIENLIITYFFPNHPLSTKLTFLIGLNSRCDIYTPGKDGIVRDEHGNVSKQISNWQTPKFKSAMEDLQMAVKDRESYIKLSQTTQLADLPSVKKRL